MKTLIVHFQETGGYRIVTDISRPAVNAEATRRRIAAETDLAPYRGLPPGAYKKKMEDLFYEKAVYLNPGPNTLAVTEEEGARLEEKRKALGVHERLTTGGGVIPDFRGVEYWYCKDGEWLSGQTGEAGVGLPAGAIPAGERTEELLKIIAGQAEARRVQNLSEEEREKEKKSATDAAKAQARNMKEEAEIAGEDFDAPAWFRERRAEIGAKYG
jgi:hypothetical protein